MTEHSNMPNLVMWDEIRARYGMLISELMLEECSSKNNLENLDAQKLTIWADAAANQLAIVIHVLQQMANDQDGNLLRACVRTIERCVKTLEDENAGRPLS